MNRAKIFIVFTFLLAFAVCVSAQSNSYPNELEDYQFFGTGKLKGLKLGVSTKEDVKKIFGKDCENYCDYNQKWRINFDYFGRITKEHITTDKKIKYVPNPKYIGSLYSITLRPKSCISFRQIIFSLNFKRGSGDSAPQSGKGIK